MDPDVSIMKKLVCVLLTVLLAASGAGNTFAQKKKTVMAKSKATSTLIGFNGGDVRAMAADSRNLYVAMAWCSYLAVIDKASGSMSKIESENEIKSVAVADGLCYYYVASKGIYSYDSATKTTAGPLFGITPESDSFSEAQMAASPDGKYLYCDGWVINLLSGKATEASGGSSAAMNNLGGLYFGNPAAMYQPLAADAYKLSTAVSVQSIFADPVTGNAYFCCDGAVGCTPAVPEAEAGLRRVKSLGDLKIDGMARDDAGNLIFALRDGIAIGGATTDDPVKTYTPLLTGITEYGMELKLSAATIVMPDGEGNIVAASQHGSTIVIFNPKGLEGYSAIRGKAARL